MHNLCVVGTEDSVLIREVSLMVAICESFQFTVYTCTYHYVHVYCIDSVRILCVLHRQSILCVLHRQCILCVLLTTQ